jgi:hypothetical protein
MNRRTQRARDKAIRHCSPEGAVRGRLALGAVAVVVLVAVTAHFFIRHSLMISQN